MFANGIHISLQYQTNDPKFHVTAYLIYKILEVTSFSTQINEKPAYS